MYKISIRIFRPLLLIIALVSLCIPYIKFIVEPWEKTDLKGAFTIYEKPIFSIDTWLNGTFQSTFDQYYNQNFSLSSPYIKINNQINYWLFKETISETAVVGSDNYLYESVYIDTHLGKDFHGESKLDSVADKVKAVQDYLKKNNTDFILILAPNKTRIYTEKMPYQFRTKTPGKTNYEYFKIVLKKKGIHYIDMNDWFISMKDSNDYLFTKYGTHWSIYSAVLATDSLFKYIAKQRGVKPPAIIIDSLTYTSIPVRSDDDIAWSLNLYSGLPETKYCYPKYRYVPSADFQKLSLLGIGDSFFWNILALIEENKPFKNYSYWYYNKLVYPISFKKETPVTPKLIKTDMKKYDVVIMITAEPNLHKVPYDINAVIK